MSMTYEHRYGAAGKYTIYYEIQIREKDAAHNRCLTVIFSSFYRKLWHILKDLFTKFGDRNKQTSSFL